MAELITLLEEGSPNLDEEEEGVAEVGSEGLPKSGADTLLVALLVESTTLELGLGEKEEDEEAAVGLIVSVADAGPAGTLVLGALLVVGVALAAPLAARVPLELPTEDAVALAVEAPVGGALAVPVTLASVVVAVAVAVPEGVLRLLLYRVAVAVPECEFVELIVPAAAEIVTVPLAVIAPLELAADSEDDDGVEVVVAAPVGLLEVSSDAVEGRLSVPLLVPVGVLVDDTDPVAIAKDTDPVVVLFEEAVPV